MTSSSNTYEIKTRTETPLQNLFLIFFNFVKFALESILTLTEQPQESGLAPSTGSSYIRTEKNSWIGWEKSDDEDVESTGSALLQKNPYLHCLPYIASLERHAMV